MKRKYPIAACLLFALSIVPSGAEVPLKHIRVIVDTSASLHHTDPSGYVKLSTELFYDLAVKEFNANDTFKVLHFPDRGDPRWKKATEPPEIVDDQKYVNSQTGHELNKVSEFHLKIRSLPYTSEYTYFSPCFKWALEDLKASGTTRKDNRVIVLITDGISDAEAADTERLSKMVPELRDNNIQVFVLAFGEASQDWFTRAFGFGGGPGVGVKGDVFAGVDSKHLLSDMVEIFSRSFGFSRQTIPAGQDLIDVARNLTLQNAAVIALYRQPGKPEFKLVPPGGQSIGASRIFTEAAAPDPGARAPSTPVSYAYQWLDSPAQGSYRFVPDGPRPDEIAVLRPVRVKSTIRSFQGNSIDVAMAGKQAPMEVLVSLMDGSNGDPGQDIHVKFHIKYLKQDDEGRDANDYPGEPEKVAVTPEGRVFEIQPPFIKNPTGWPLNEAYPAFIDVEITQFDTPVDRMGDLMHPVTVYPYHSVGVQPNPAIVTSNGKDVIHRGQEGCVSSLHFVDNTQNLASEPYTLAVRLLDPTGTGTAWTGARFRFDGKEFSGLGSDWQATEAVDPKELAQGKHTFCVIADDPSVQGPQDLQIHFGFWRNSADANERQLNIVDDLVVKATIAAPDFWQIWSPWLMLLLTALLCLLLLLLLRSKHELAPDLGVALGARSGLPASASAGGRTFGWGWLGFPQERPVFSMDGDREIGTVKPSRDDLFIFHPGRGFGNVSEMSGGNWVPVQPGEDGSYRLAAGITYRAGMNNDIHLFRIEYSQERPRI
jgi:hypothetical protein